MRRFVNLYAVAKIFIPFFFSFSFIIFADLPPADDTLTPKKPTLDVTINEQIGASLEAMQFFDETGKPVQLKDISNGHQVIILSPVYYNCTNLCLTTLNTLLEYVEKKSRYTLGKDYIIVTYSFDPKENFELGQLKQNFYLKKLSAVNDKNIAKYKAYWRFLTARQDAINTIAKTIGFKYLKEVSGPADKSGGVYVHPAVLIFVTPDFKIMRYIYNIDYSPTNFRLAVLEASSGKISKTIVDRVLSTIYAFDATKRKYNLVASNVMWLGGITAFLLLLIFLTTIWIKEKRKYAKKENL
ncbi:MAG: hypothetical protein LDLANPLL_01941 [Turneriella sp.]|nr:hypothetical protein [Turneriella sp.]